jgi:hypothetical protein
MLRDFTVECGFAFLSAALYPDRTTPIFLSGETPDGKPRPRYNEHIEEPSIAVA